MLADYELRGLLRGAAIFVDAAMMAAKGMGIKEDPEQSPNQGIRALLDFLEMAASDLERATSGHSVALPYKEMNFPTKAKALEAIGKLPLDDTVGFHMRPDGEGRCAVRIWFAGRPD